MGGAYSYLCFLCGKNLLEIAPNNARGLSSVNSSPKSPALVVFDNRTSLGVEGGQTLAERIDVVVGPLD